MLGEIKCLLLGDELRRFSAEVWKHFIQSKRYYHIHPNVPRAAVQLWPQLGKSTDSQSFLQCVIVTAV